MTQTRALMTRQRLLADLRSGGPMGRADLARRLGLSVQAVSNITETLLDQGVIAEAGRREGGRGLPVVLYDLAPGGAFSLGYEIRPAAVYGTVMDQTGQIRDQQRLALTDPAPGPVLDAIAAHSAGLSAYHPRMIGAGIVRPGPFGATGFPLSGNELPGWDLPDLDARLERATGLPVTLDKDATAGASAEHLQGRYGDDFAYLYFGSGLGLGVLSRGQPLRGAFGNSGEIGSLRLSGLSGPLEAHLSRAALEQALADQGHIAPTLDAIAALHDAGTPALTDWLDGAAQALALAAEAIENLFDPATIVLGGALPAPVLRDLIDRCPLPPGTIAARPGRALARLCLGTCGPFTVSAGAAALILNRHFTAPSLP